MLKVGDPYAPEIGAPQYLVVMHLLKESTQSSADEHKQSSLYCKDSRLIHASACDQVDVSTKNKKVAGLSVIC
jgi:hypothetical protein